LLLEGAANNHQWRRGFRPWSSA